MAIEFLYKHKDLIRLDIRESSAGTGDIAGNEDDEKETAAPMTKPDQQNHQNKNEK
jgi:heme-binding NEAT domain protein